jgi:hypothetical protein
MSRNRHNDYGAIYGVCTAWWRGLQRLDDDGRPIISKGSGSPLPPDRAALARLRRIGVVALNEGEAVDVGHALGIPAFRELIDGLRWNLDDKSRAKRQLDAARPHLEPFAIAAATLAFIRADAGNGAKDRGATARMLGAPRGENASADERLFAEPRFKRLIRTRDDWPGLLSQARRIAAILEKEAPIGDLGASLILWNADPRVSRDWAFQYYSQRPFEAAAERETVDVSISIE